MNVTGLRGGLRGTLRGRDANYGIIRPNESGMEHKEPRACVHDLRQAAGGQGAGGERA